MEIAIIILSVIIGVGTFLWLMEEDESPKSPKHPYEFEISMGKDETYSAIVWRKPFGGGVEIVHSRHNVTLEEAQDFINERASFLDQTNYTVKKRLSEY